MSDSEMLEYFVMLQAQCCVERDAGRDAFTRVSGRQF